LPPKRPFDHISAKVTLILAGGAITSMAFASTPTASAPGQPGGTATSAGAARSARLDRAMRTGSSGPVQTVALVAYGRATTDPPDPPDLDPDPHRPKHHPARHHHPAHHRLRHHHARHHHAWRGSTPGQIAYVLLPSYNWAPWQFHYLDLLWIRESGWNPYAANPYSGAYGIPQALPGSKMASAGADWRTNARTQIIWGMGYIKSRYGTPWGAWQHELQYGWY
jgi:hypothetical protein